MKIFRSHIILTAFVTIMSLLLFDGCRKAPINGKLDGQWQIMNIELTADGSDASPAIRSYIDINLHVVNLRNIHQSLIAGSLNYDKDASWLTLDFPYNAEGDALLRLREWGIYQTPVTFDIVKLDSKQLVLRSPETIITCRRF